MFFNLRYIYNLNHEVYDLGTIQNIQYEFILVIFFLGNVRYAHQGHSNDSHINNLIF
jgi:hypothetical protein